MINKRQYLGSTEIRTDYWSGGKDSRELKLNETLLYAEINCANEYVLLANTYEEASLDYNKQDLMFLCLMAVDKCGADYDLLARYGRIIGNMIGEGKIYRQYASLDAENAALDNMIDEMYRRAEGDEFCDNTDFLDWYTEKVLAYNCYKNYDGTITYDRPKLVAGLSGLGGDSDTFSSQMVDSGGYMLYQLNEPSDVYDGCVDEYAMRRKLKEQDSNLEWLANSGTNLTRDSILVNARQGIARDTKMRPKEALDSMKRGEGLNGMGFVITSTVVTAIIYAVIAIISAIAAIVTAAINGRAEVFAAKLKATAPSDENINATCPNPGDYGYEDIKELQERMADAESDSKIYNTLSKPAFVAGIVAVFVAIFGAAIYSSRKKKRNHE